jgi:predicted phosphodiesterase
MKIVVIPDTQVKPDVNTDHIAAAGNYIVRHKPDAVVVLGDWWDMPSLSMFNSNLEVEGLRVLADLKAGDRAMERFMTPLRELQAKQLKDKKKVYKPRLIYTVGNHDPQVRIPRYVEANPQMQGMISGEWTSDYLREFGFEVYEYREIVEINGIRFSHWFSNPHAAKKGPLGGMIDTQIKNAGFSFVQGHTQGLKMGKHYLSDSTKRLGIVAGSFYSHDEDFMGPQGNASHWRGIIQLNEVSEGGADICELSLDYLIRKYYNGK